VATARHTLIGDEKEEWRKIQVLIIDEISMVSIKWAGKRWMVPF
jgi:ATP-dependent exoDNAse (exonuclease V) alpha subunit